MAVFIQSLKNSGHLDRLHFTICNVGSRKLSIKDDYASQGWQMMASQLTIYGFDADADACDAANADLEARQINWTEKHIPLALGKAEEEATLYVTKSPMCSSLYPPNEIYLARFAGLPELVNLDFTIEIETTTLDSFCQAENIQKIDFLQIDVQGADLDVLQGATELLNRSILALQIEVEFAPLYSNQPLFADIDIHLRNQGFSLFDIAVAHRSRTCSPLVSKIHPGQLLWGDAYYFRDLLQENLNTPFNKPDQILKLACIADIMDFPDYALEILEHLTLEYGKNEPQYNFADNIIQSLSQFPELIKQELASLTVIKNIQDYASREVLATLRNSEV